MHLYFYRNELLYKDKNMLQSQKKDNKDMFLFDPVIASSAVSVKSTHGPCANSCSKSIFEVLLESQLSVLNRNSTT